MLLPVYYKSLRQTQLSRLENIQYRAAKIVTGALHFTNREKLNNELGWESIFLVLIFSIRYICMRQGL